MSKKRILNISSRKKRDGMRPASFPQFVTGSVINSPYNMNAGSQLTVLGWCATARDNEVLATPPTPGNIINEACRTATRCFMRGLKENIEITTSSGTAWRWRRVCFTFKSNEIIRNDAASAGLSPLWFEDSSGYRRGLFSLTSANAEAVAVFGNLQTLLFKGTLGIDYDSFMTAPLDTRRVNPKWDKIKTIKSGNQQGTVREFKEWHPMNKNLVYDDDENGDLETVSLLSTSGREGMGDYYVIDFFAPVASVLPSDQLIFDPTATLYWHEK